MHLTISAFLDFVNVHCRWVQPISTTVARRSASPSGHPPAIIDLIHQGDGDSEIALVIEDEDMVDSFMDGQRYKAARFAATLRRKLFRGPFLTYFSISGLIIPIRASWFDPSSRPFPALSRSDFFHAPSPLPK